LKWLNDKFPTHSQVIQIQEYLKSEERARIQKAYRKAQQKKVQGTHTSQRELTAGKRAG